MDKGLVNSPASPSAQVGKANVKPQLQNPNITLAQNKITKTGQTSSIAFSSPALSQPVIINITHQQANLLQSSSFVLINQQQVQVFLQSQLIHKQLSLSPELAKLVTAWLQQNGTNKDKNFINKTLPAELAKLLTGELGIETGQLLNRIKHLAIQQQLLSLSVLHGDALVTATLGQNRSNLNPEQLSQLLQLIIPLSDDSRSSVRFIMERGKEQNANNNNDEKQTNKFELAFTLSELGVFKVKVELQEFQLATQCIYSNLALEQKVKKHWPLLSERLSKLGFEIENNFIYQPEISSEISNNHENHKGLINVKV